MAQFIDPDDPNLIPHPLWKVTLPFNGGIPGELSERISAAIEDLAVSVFLHNEEATNGDRWRIELTTYGEPDIEEIFPRLCLLESVENKPGLIVRSEITAERLPEKDWLQHVHDNFPPVTIGSFFVYGSHYTGDIPTSLKPLQIDAATAFGSGEHETTRGCILCLEKLAEQHVFKNALDMGCGSGILAIAAAKICPALRVTAIDIDPESIIVTARHAKMNSVSDKIVTEAGDGYHAPTAIKNAPYDLIAANILSRPLIEMAPQLAAVLSPGGFCVLSGLLRAQEDDVIAAHVNCGMALIHRECLGEWRALILRKNP